MREWRVEAALFPRPRGPKARAYPALADFRRRKGFGLRAGDRGDGQAETPAHGHGRPGCKVMAAFLGWPEALRLRRNGHRGIRAEALRRDGGPDWRLDRASDPRVIGRAVAVADAAAAFAVRTIVASQAVDPDAASFRFRRAKSLQARALDVSNRTDRPAWGMA